MTRIYLNEKIYISNKDFRIYKQNWKKHSTLLYLQFQVASINPIKQKSNPDCHISHTINNKQQFQTMGI